MLGCVALGKPSFMCTESAKKLNVCTLFYQRGFSKKKWNNLITTRNQGSKITQSIESNVFRFMFNNVCFRPETRLRALIEDDWWIWWTPDHISAVVQNKNFFRTSDPIFFASNTIRGFFVSESWERKRIELLFKEEKTVQRKKSQKLKGYWKNHLAILRFGKLE